MRHATTLNFIDAESKDEACIIVRYNDVTVSLSVSLRTDGDLTVCMTKEEAKALLEGLRKSTS